MPSEASIDGNVAAVRRVSLKQSMLNEMRHPVERSGSDREPWRTQMRLKWSNTRHVLAEELLDRWEASNWT